MEGVVAVLQGVEHLRVRLEGDGGAGVVGLAHHLHLLGDLSPGKLHLIDLAVLVDLDLQPLAQGVYHAGAYAVQTAGNLVAAAAKLAAGVEDSEDDLQSGTAGLGLDVHGDAAAVVGDGDGVAGIDGHGDIGAVARQGLVDGVIHNFVHQVMKSRLTGRADVHARALAHRLQALQNLDLRAAVLVLHLGGIELLKLVVFCHMLTSGQVVGRVERGGERRDFFPLRSQLSVLLIGRYYSKELFSIRRSRVAGDN